MNQFAGLPTVCIASPANGATVSDVIAVVVGAQDDSRLSAVDLFLDDVPIGTITEGDLSFIVDTTHFANGTHTLLARAQDNAGMPHLGGVANNMVVANETYSPPVLLDFQNSVRWPEAETLFESIVPINVESDIFPADWTVVVEDISGSSVKSFSGFTSDGLIQTNWDGTDANNNQVPTDAAYKITVVIDSASSGMMAGALTASTETPTLKRTGVDRYGMPDFEITERVPDELGAYNEQFKRYFSLTDQEKGELPPIPPAPSNPTTTTRTKKMPLSRILGKRGVALQSDVQLAVADAASGTSGSVRTVAWRESAWSSGKTILARQRYRSSLVGLTFNATLGTRLNQVALLIAEAAAELGNSRDVLNSTVFVVPDHGGYSVLTNDLARSEVRGFYYHGHANGNGVGYSELTPNEGILARNLQLTLGNIYLPNVSTTRSVYEFRKPFTFVFIDGCLSGTGELPESFGIPKAIAAANYAAYGHRKSRAFMGWMSTTQDSIANTDFLNWTFKFWQEWLNDPDYNRTLREAIDTANGAYPGIPNRAPLAVYGADTLRWRD